MSQKDYKKGGRDGVEQEVHRGLKKHVAVRSSLSGCSPFIEVVFNPKIIKLTINSLHVHRYLVNLN